MPTGKQQDVVQSESSSDDEFEDATESPIVTAAAAAATKPTPIAENVLQNNRIPHNSHIKLSDVKMTEADLRSALSDSRHALTFFMNSRIREAEDFCWPKATTSLYHSLGYAMVQVGYSLRDCT